jgi:hypothetical protein
MADPQVSELNTASQILFNTNVTDNFGKNDPLIKYWKDTRSIPFDSGSKIQNPFIYAGMVGGPYSEGDTFNIDVVDILSANQFTMRKYEVNVSDYLSRINIENGDGDQTKIKLIDLKMEEAVLTMSRKLAIAQWHHGQASGTTITENRIKHINGIAEAINNGLDNSWEGDLFTTYGGTLRGGVTGTANSGNIRWFGDANGAPGAIGYSQIVRSMLAARVGGEMPNLITLNKFGLATVLEKFQIQQRFVERDNIVLGAKTFSIMGADLVVSDYMPSLVDGVNDPDGNYLTGTYTSAASGETTASGLPANKTIQVNELIGFFNTDTWDFYVSNSALYGFGWTGFKVAQDSDMVAGQHLAACNLLCRAPRLNMYGYGFNS